MNCVSSNACLYWFIMVQAWAFKQDGKILRWQNWELVYLLVSEVAGEGMSPGGVFLSDSLKDSVWGLLAQLLGSLQDALGCQEDGGHSTEPLGYRLGRVSAYRGHGSSTAAAIDMPTGTYPGHDTQKSYQCYLHELASINAAIQDIEVISGI